MENNKDSPQNIVKFLEQRNSFNVPSRVVQKFCKMTTFSTQLLDNWTDDEFTKLPFLTSNEVLDLFKNISSSLRILNVAADHCLFRKRVLVFGNFPVRVKRFFKFLRLFKIVHEECVHLEEATFDMDLDCIKCKLYNSSCNMYMNEEYGDYVAFVRGNEFYRDMLFYLQTIFRNNLKLRVLILKFTPDLHDIFLRGKIVLPVLQELTVHLAGIRDFSLVANNLTLIDISDNTVMSDNLQFTVEEILRHKQTLQCLRIRVFVDSTDAGHGLSHLAKLQRCTLLTELRIEIDNYRIEVEGDWFFNDIIKGCPKLENVYFENITLTDETLNQLYSLPNYKQVFLMKS